MVDRHLSKQRNGSRSKTFELGRGQQPDDLGNAMQVDYEETGVRSWHATDLETARSDVPCPSAHCRRGIELHAWPGGDRLVPVPHVADFYCHHRSVSTVTTPTARCSIERGSRMTEVDAEEVQRMAEYGQNQWDKIGPMLEEAAARDWAMAPPVEPDPLDGSDDEFPALLN